MIALLLALLPPADRIAEPHLVDRVGVLEFNRYWQSGEQLVIWGREGKGWCVDWRPQTQLYDLVRRKGSITFRDGCDGPVRTIYAWQIIDTVTPTHDPERDDYKRLEELNRQRHKEGKIELKRIGLRKPEHVLRKASHPVDLPPREPSE